MNIEQQNRLKQLQDEGCRILIEHPRYVSDSGRIFMYTEEYVKSKTEDGQRRVAGEFGYRSSVYSDVALSSVDISDVWVCRHFDSEE